MSLCKEGKLYPRLHYAKYRQQVREVISFTQHCVATLGVQSSSELLSTRETWICRRQSSHVEAAIGASFLCGKAERA